MNQNNLTKEQLISLIEDMQEYKKAGQACSPDLVERLASQCLMQLLYIEGYKQKIEKATEDAYNLGLNTGRDMRALTEKVEQNG